MKYEFNEEDEDEDKMEGNSNIKLVLTKKLKDKLDYLSNYDETEVSGFLTYSNIEQEEDEVKITLNDILIPPQKAEKCEVDVDGNGQVELRKEYGDKCLKIIGHFHSHRTMGCFFSSTDEDMMKSYSENKPFCIFVVGSEGKHLMRLILRNNVNGTDIPMEIMVENIEYEVEADDSIKAEMEEEIKKKVEKAKVQTIKVYCNSTSEIKKLKKEVSVRIKYYQHQNHKVKVEKIYKCYANLISEEFKTLNPIIEKSDEENHFNVVVELGNRNKAKEFMCDVKAFLLKQLLNEKEKEEERKEEIKTEELNILGEDKEVDDELEEYLSGLEDDEIEELEREGKLERGLHSNWKDYRDEMQKMRDDFNKENTYISY